MINEYRESRRIALIEFKAMIEKLVANFANTIDTLGNQLVKLDTNLRQLKKDQSWQEIDIEQN